MARKKQSTPGRPGSPAWWPGRFLNQVVAESGAPEELREFYFRFAAELYHSMTRSPAEEFEENAKQVVTKWLNRGLSGRLLRLIGSAIIRRLCPPQRFGDTIRNHVPKEK